MTPRQYASLRDQHKIRIRHEELLNAIVAASVVNTSMCAPETPTPFTKYMPSEWVKIPAKKPRKKRRTKAEWAVINQNIHCFFTARAIPQEP